MTVVTEISVARARSGQLVVTVPRYVKGEHLRSPQRTCALLCLVPHALAIYIYIHTHTNTHTHTQEGKSLLTACLCMNECMYVSE